MSGRWTTPADSSDRGRRTTDGGPRTADGGVGAAGVARRTDGPHVQLQTGATPNAASGRYGTGDRVSAQAALPSSYPARR